MPIAPCHFVLASVLISHVYEEVEQLSSVQFIVSIIRGPYAAPRRNYPVSFGHYSVVYRKGGQKEHLLGSHYPRYRELVRVDRDAVDILQSRQNGWNYLATMGFLIKSYTFSHLHSNVVRKYFHPK